MGGAAAAMRKGSRRVDWTTEDERYLLDHAGIEPKRSICFHLKRSGKAVEMKARELRARGYPVSLRTQRPLTAICPRCSQARSREGDWQERTGFCEVCRMQASYEDALRRQAEAYEALTPEQRWEYDRSQAATGRSTLPPRPRAPQTIGMDPRAARRAEELHALEVEEWEKARLRRLTNAAKQRTKRMREKSGTNPRKNGEKVKRANQ